MNSKGSDCVFLLKIIIYRYCYKVIFQRELQTVVDSTAQVHLGGLGVTTASLVVSASGNSFSHYSSVVTVRVYFRSLHEVMLIIANWQNVD
jgi:hypothetical protein